jgi:hypothetical protein
VTYLAGMGGQAQTLLYPYDNVSEFLIYLTMSGQVAQMFLQPTDVRRKIGERVPVGIRCF